MLKHHKNKPHHYNNYHSITAMKKLHRKNSVHPTPTPPPVVSDHLISFLPSAILTLTLVLSTEEKQVLAYLISCSSTNFSNNCQKPIVRSVDHNHSPCFYCSCFSCYMSYWVKWDSSPKREVIHDIIDAFEASNLVKECKNKKQRRKGKKGNSLLNESKSCLTSVELKNSVEEVVVEEEELEKGSVRKFVSFLGEKIWSYTTIFQA